jgi:TolA-binding protein
MTSGWNATRKTIAGLVLASLTATALPAPATAQDDARLRRIESELRALQRAVFPGGDRRYFEPEVDTSQPQAQPQTVGTPSTSALTDVLARLDALEAQLARLTARTEENANQMSLLEAEVKEMRDAAAATPVAVTPPATGVIPVPSGNRPAATTPSAPAQAAPSPARVAAVQAITKPSTSDAGEDEYTYGFRLWDAGFYPEARQQLSLFLQKHPDHRMASYGRNLLGRAFLDDGQPREAAAQFLENYQKDKNGARAPDSLLFLSEAMIGIGDTDRACIALAEFSEAYPALATGRLKEQYDRNRSKVRCR